MSDLSAGYHTTRLRISDLVRSLDVTDLDRPVPACPAWNVRQLVAHLVAIPEAIVSGNLPSGDFQPWLDAIRQERETVPVPELLDRWDAIAAATSAVVDGGGTLMFLDVVSHEHDLRGAVERPGSRGTPEVRACVQLMLDQLAKPITEAGLGALVIDSGEVRWASQFARPGCTLRVDPWEAIRVLQSRRTADEVLALPATGDVEPYLAVLHDHSPLPETSLGES